MKITEMPWALRPAITSSSFSVSAIGRLEVGSSRMTRRDRRLSAFAISTICCSAIESRATGVAGENVAPSRSRSGWTSFCSRSLSTRRRKPYFLGSRPI